MAGEMTTVSDGFGLADELAPERARAMMRLYCKKLDDLGYSAHPYPNVDAKVGANIYAAGKFEALNHALWMCGQVEGFLRQNRMAKAYRWIGMVQGLLFMGGIYSISELKKHNALSE